MSVNKFDSLVSRVKANERTLLWILVSVLLTTLGKGCFDKTPVNPELVRLQERVKYIEEKRISDSLSNAAFIKLKDEKISEIKNKEAVIVNQYISTNDKLKNIPASINALVRDSLKSAIERYVVLPD